VKTKQIVLLIGLAVLASGCTNLPLQESEKTETEGPSAENGGLEVVSFEAGQSELRTGQKTQLKLTLKNHHVEDISIEDMTIYNYGLLEAEDETLVWEDRCTPGEIRRNINSNPPDITCEWTVEAPEDLDDFDSKSANPKIRILYNSKVSNSKEPMNLQFKPFDDIESNTDESRTVDNGEVTLSISAENPAPLDTGSKVDVGLQNSGHGTVIDNEDDPLYQVDIEPASLFSGDCSSTMSLDPAIDSEASLTCIASPEASNEVERKMIVSASYIYQKTPSVNIEVAR
jgi:hypothetical protein